MLIKLGLAALICRSPCGPLSLITHACRIIQRRVSCTTAILQAGAALPRVKFPSGHVAESAFRCSRREMVCALGSTGVCVCVCDKALGLGADARMLSIRLDLGQMSWPTCPPHYSGSPRPPHLPLIFTRHHRRPSVPGGAECLRSPCVKNEFIQMGGAEITVSLPATWNWTAATTLKIFDLYCLDNWLTWLGISV